YRLIDELDSRRRRLRQTMREDVVLYFRSEDARAAPGQTLVVGPAPPEDGIDGAEEGGHTVVPGYARAIEPVDVAVLAGDIAIGTGGDVDDDATLAVHGVRGYGATDQLYAVLDDFLK